MLFLLCDRTLELEIDWLVPARAVGDYIYMKPKPICHERFGFWDFIIIINQKKKKKNFLLPEAHTVKCALFKSGHLYL